MGQLRLGRRGSSPGGPPGRGNPARPKGPAPLKGGRARAPFLTAALAGALCGVFRAGVSPALALDPALARTQPWRILSWPLAHASLAHLLWDLAAFIALGALVERRGRARFAAILGLAALLPGVAWAALASAPLAGASGWDSALFAVAALDLLGRSGATRWPRALGVLALLLFAAKTALEAASGHALFLPGAVPAAAGVHLLSALLGGGAWLLFRRARATLNA